MAVAASLHTSLHSARPHAPSTQRAVHKALHSSLALASTAVALTTAVAAVAAVAAAAAILTEERCYGHAHACGGRQRV
jgi:hypothetical protein